MIHTRGTQTETMYNGSLIQTENSTEKPQSTIYPTYVYNLDGVCGGRHLLTGVSLGAETWQNSVNQFK